MTVVYHGRMPNTNGGPLSGRDKLCKSAQHVNTQFYRNMPTTAVARKLPSTLRTEAQAPHEGANVHKTARAAYSRFFKNIKPANAATAYKTQAVLLLDRCIKVELGFRVLAEYCVDEPVAEPSQAASATASGTGSASGSSVPGLSRTVVAPVAPSPAPPTGAAASSSP